MQSTGEHRAVHPGIQRHTVECGECGVCLLPEAKRRAEDALAGQVAEFEYAKAQAELAEAAAQLRAIEKLRKMKG